MAGGERGHAAKVLSAPVAAHWSRMINGQTWPSPHLALTASGDKSWVPVRDGVCSALQGQGLTPTETLEESWLNIHCRQAGRQAPCLETSNGNARSRVWREALYLYSMCSNHTGGAALVCIYGCSSWAYQRMRSCPSCLWISLKRLREEDAPSIGYNNNNNGLNRDTTEAIWQPPYTFVPLGD